MNKIRCLIVDDEAVARRIITKYLDDLSDFEIIAESANAMEAMKILETEEIDLMFLDIEMPKLKGLAFLKTLTNPPAVIITTAHREYALEGYEVEAIDYLLKPISFERFIKAVNRYKQIYSKPIASTQSNELTEEGFIYVKSDRKTIKLKMSEIHYLEGMNNYVCIHTATKKHIVYNTMTDLLNELNDHFVRIHKSFVVNKNKISSFNKEQVEIGDVALPIGRTFKDIVNEF